MISRIGFLVVGCFFSFSLSGQTGLTPEGWIGKLEEAESPEKNSTEIISELERLTNSYLQAVGKDSIYARMASRLGDRYRSIGDFEKGMSLLSESLRINKLDQPGSERSYLAHTYLNLALLFKNINLLNESELYLDSCLRIIELYPKKNHLKSRVYEELAYNYFQRGDYQRNVEIVDYGLSQPDVTSNQVDVAFLLLQKGQAQLALQQIPLAEENIRKALEIVMKSDLHEFYRTTVYEILCVLLVDKGSFEEALAYYDKAYQITKRNGYLNAAAVNLSEIGLIYGYFLNRPAEALAYYNKSIELLKDWDDDILLANLKNNLGHFLWEQKDYKNAIRNFHAGLNVLTSMDFSDTLWLNNPRPNQIKFSSQDFLVSLLLANKGESLLGLYKTEEDPAVINSALQTFKLADLVVDQMRWNHPTQQSKLFWRERFKKMYEQAIEVCYLLNDPESAFYFFEKSRAVLLNDKLNELGARQHLSQADQDKEKSLRVGLASAQQKLLQLEVSDSAYRYSVAERYDVQVAYEKFIKSLEAKYPTYYQYKYDTAVSSVSDLQNSLADNEQTYIGYFAGENYIYMLTVNSTSASLSRVESGQTDEEISELLAICADRSRINQNYPRYSELSRNLYERLFKPLSVNTRRVIVSPDDRFIPFELLLKERNDPTSFLVQDHAFSYTYSAGYLLKNKHESSKVGPTLVGVAPVNYQPHLQQATLQGSDLSLNSIQSQFSSSEIIVGEKATKQEFIKHLPDYGIVQLYSHADADMGGTEPTIYFYDSALKVSDLQLLGDLPTRLVVLSACNTGVGKNIKGEGVFSLARGFAAAGIPSSITSLWQIDNRSTFQITELFYKYLGEGLPLDIALQEAKLEFLRTQDKSYDLPYFWAGSILLGNADGFLPDRANYIYSLPHLIGLISVAFIIISSLIYHKKHRRNKAVPQKFRRLISRRN